MLNVEGAISFLIVLLIAARALRAPALANPIAVKTKLAFDWRDAIVVAAIFLGVFALYWRAAHIGFLSDDYVLLAGAPDYRPRVIFFTGGGDGFYRPLIYAIFTLTRRFAGLDPWTWHLAGLAVHAVNAILVYAIARSLAAYSAAYFNDSTDASRFTAAFAAALFAVHASHPEVALWITGRFDLFATLFVLLALFFWIHSWDATSARALADRVLAMLCMTAGLLSKESAYAFPVMIAALAIVNPRWRKPAALVPFFAIAAALFAWRWHLLAGIGGYRTAAGTPEILSQSVFGIFKGFALRVWGILFFPVDWSIHPGIVLIAIIALYSLAVLLLPAIRPKREPFLFAFALTLATLAPVLHLLRIGANLEKARYLYLPSAMFALMIAAALATSKWRWLLAAVILVFQAAALGHNLTAWELSSSKAESACATAAETASEIAADPARAANRKIAILGVPSELNGAYFFGNGLPECVELRNSRRADISMIPDPSRLPDPAQFAAVLRWDAATSTLTRIR